MNNCPKCGTELLPNAKACPSCGEVLSSSAEDFTFDYNSLYSENNEATIVVEETSTKDQNIVEVTPVENSEESAVESNQEEVEKPQSIENQEVEVQDTEETEDKSTEQDITEETPVENSEEPTAEINQEVEAKETEDKSTEQDITEETPVENSEESTAEINQEVEAKETEDKSTEQDITEETPVENSEEPTAEINQEVEVQEIEPMPDMVNDNQSISETPVMEESIITPTVDMDDTPVIVQEPGMPVIDIMPIENQAELPQGISEGILAVEPISMENIGYQVLDPIVPMDNQMGMPVGIPEIPAMSIPMVEPMPMENVGYPVLEPVFPIDNQMGMPSIMPEPQMAHMINAPEMQSIPTITGLQQEVSILPTITTQQTASYTPPVIPQHGGHETDSKFNRIIFIIVMLIALVAIGLMSFFMIKMFNGENSNTNTDEIGKATQYNYEGFEFYLPNNVVADVVEGDFILASTDSTWNAVVTLQDGSYNTLVSNKSQLKSYYEQLGYVVGEPEEKEISGTGFVTLEVAMGSQKVLVAYAKANGIKLFGIVLTNETKEYGNDSLKDIGRILSTMKYNGYKYGLPEGFTIDMFKGTFRIAE